MENITLILCNPRVETRLGLNVGMIRQLPSELHLARAEDLNACAESATTPVLTIARESVLSLGELEESLKLFHAHPNLVMVLFFSATQEEATDAWQKLPPRVAALRQNWAHSIQAVVVKVSGLKNTGFAEVSDPLWDLVIRTAQSPGSIQVRQGTEAPLEKGTYSSPELPALVPAVPSPSRHWLKQHLQSVTPEELVPKSPSRPDAVALKAGLWQIHDFLHESHELSQSIEGEGKHSAGDYWHAITHRREPDYSNAKYWFRQVGRHPIFDPLRKAVDAMLQDSENPATQNARHKLFGKSEWDPLAFVDFCQECAKGNDPELTRIAEEIQWQEMRLLLEQTYRDATE